MARQYFGTDGVRGVVGETLTAELVEQLGKAAALWGGRAPRDDADGFPTPRDPAIMADPTNQLQELATLYGVQLNYCFFDHFGGDLLACDGIEPAGVTRLIAEAQVRLAHAADDELSAGGAGCRPLARSVPARR